MEEATEYCSNCKRIIAKANFLIHSAHCQRNIKICETCGEPVPVKDVDEHIAEMHAAASCEKCNKTMEKWKLEDHESTCPKRPVACSYCEMDCSWDESKDHETYCGARTEKCPECQQYVMFKDKARHDIFQCSKLKTEVTAQSVKGKDAIFCFGCKSFITSDFDIHQRLCSAPKDELLKQLTSKHTEQKSHSDISTVIDSFSKLSMSEDEEIARNLNAEASAPRELRRYSKSLYPLPKKRLDCPVYNDCQAVKSTGDTLDNNNRNKECSREVENAHCNPQNKPESKMSETRMCPTCKQSFVKYQYNSHVELCRRIHSRCEICNEVMSTSMLQKHTEMCVKQQPSSESKGNHEDNSFLQKNGMLKCPTCKEKLTTFELEDHMATCRPRVEKCLKCQEEVLVSEFETHKEVCRTAHNSPSMQRSSGRGRGAFPKTIDVGNNVPVSSLNPAFRKKFLVEKKEQECLTVDSNDYQSTVKGGEVNKVFTSRYSFKAENVEDVQSPEKEEILVNCPYCNTRFSVSKIDFHLMNCSARLEECMLCKKGVPVAELKRHQESCSAQPVSQQPASHSERDASDEKSSLVTCYNCNASFSRSEYLKHLILCEKGKCATCHQMVSISQLKQHEVNCFARLKECAVCKKKLRSAELKVHQDLCTKSCGQAGEHDERNALDLKNFLVTCRKCSASFPRSEISEHVAHCVENQCSNDHHIEPHAQLQQHEESCSARLNLPTKPEECMVCHKLVPGAELKSHQALCARSNSQSAEHSERNTPRLQNTLVTCERCRAEFPFSAIDAHVALCAEDECGICLKMVPLGQLQHHKENCSKSRSFMKEINGSGGKLSVNDYQLIKCPTCGKKFSGLDINDHVHHCCSNICDICERTIPTSAFEYHRRQCHLEKRLSEKDRKENSNSQSHIKGDFKNCPVCDQVILSGDLDVHVSQCTEGKTLCSACGILVSDNVYERHFRECSIPLEGSVVELPTRNYAQAAASIPIMSKKQKRKHKKEWTLENNDQEYPALAPRRSESVYEAQTVCLPCEFCYKLFPEYNIIQHQSACRPDLLHLPPAQKDEEERYFSASESLEENKKMKSQENEAEEDVQSGEYLRTLQQGILRESPGYPFADVINPHSDSSDEDKNKPKFHFRKAYDMDPNKTNSFPTKDLTSKNLGKYGKDLSFDTGSNDLSDKKSAEDGKVEKKMTVSKPTVVKSKKKSQKRGGRRRRR